MNQKDHSAIQSRMRSEAKRQCLVAVLVSVAAIGDGVAMVITFQPVIVLSEIFLASLAVIQWSIYLDIKLKLAIIEEQLSRIEDSSGN